MQLKFQTVLKCGQLNIRQKSEKNILTAITERRVRSGASKHWLAGGCCRASGVQCPPPMTRRLHRTALSSRWPLASASTDIRSNFELMSQERDQNQSAKETGGGFKRQTGLTKQFSSKHQPGLS